MSTVIMMLSMISPLWLLGALLLHGPINGLPAQENRTERGGADHLQGRADKAVEPQTYSQQNRVQRHEFPRGISYVELGTPIAAGIPGGQANRAQPRPHSLGTRPAIIQDHCGLRHWSIVTCFHKQSFGNTYCPTMTNANGSPDRVNGGLADAGAAGKPRLRQRGFILLDYFTDPAPGQVVGH